MVHIKIGTLKLGRWNELLDYGSQVTRAKIKNAKLKQNKFEKMFPERLCGAYSIKLSHMLIRSTWIVPYRKSSWLTDPWDNTKKHLLKRVNSFITLEVRLAKLLRINHRSKTFVIRSLLKI